MAGLAPSTRCAPRLRPGARAGSRRGRRRPGGRSARQRLHRPADGRAAAAECLACHSDPNLRITLPDGEMLSLYVSAGALRSSVHGQLGIECQSCHTNITTYPHPAESVTTRRELLTLLLRGLPEMPSGQLQPDAGQHARPGGRRRESEAPICTDCHGAHDVRAPDQPRAAHLANLRAVPHRHLRRVLQERPRQCADAAEQPGRAGVHRLPRRPQHPRPAHRHSSGSKPRSCAPAATPTAS